MDVLAIDVGGSHAKFWHSATKDHHRVDTGKQFTPDELVGEVHKLTDWTWDVVALGLPCRVRKGRPIEDPENLGPGWKEFDYAAALGESVRMMNDADLQALGSYEGGRMLCLGLGTAVGSTLIAERLVLSLDLGRLTHEGRPLSELLGDAGVTELGLTRWQAILQAVLPMLQTAMLADYVVVGGGNAREIDPLPEGVRRGDNRNVADGARRLWHELPDPAKSMQDWMIV